MHASSARPAATIGGAASINWGDPVIRFLKLDGFAAYLKLDGMAQQAQYYKDQIISDVGALYDTYPTQVADLLGLYHKASGGPLEGILIGLETYYKEKGNLQPLLDYLNMPGAMEAYLKFERFFSALQAVNPEGQGAFSFFYKETGIAGNPLGRDVGGQPS